MTKRAPKAKSKPKTPPPFPPTPRVPFKVLLKALYRTEFERTYHIHPANPIPVAPGSKQNLKFQVGCPDLTSHGDGYHRITQRLNYLLALEVLHVKELTFEKEDIRERIAWSLDVVHAGSLNEAIEELRQVWEWEKQCMKDPRMREWCREKRYPYVGEVVFGVEKGDPGYKARFGWFRKLWRGIVSRGGRELYT